MLASPPSYPPYPPSSSQHPTQPPFPQQSPPGYSPYSAENRRLSPEELAILASNKIYKVNGKDKVVDFNLNFVPDSGMGIHGRGGKDSTRNSVVEVKICDYSHGKGNSVTVNATIPAFDIDALYHAAIFAELGLLTAGEPDLRWTNAALGIFSAAASFTHTNDGFVVCPVQWIADLSNVLQSANRSAKKPGEPWYSYNRSVNYGSFKTVDGLAEVKIIRINYTPVREDGSVSNYPWYIEVTNCMAPVRKSSSGGTAHDLKNAQNIQKASILLSAQDFAVAMSAIMTSKSTWESIAAKPVMEKRLSDRANLVARMRGNP